jgi:hypothetical protein
MLTIFTFEQAGGQAPASNESVLKQSAHPTALLFHVGFKLAALFVCVSKLNLRGTTANAKADRATSPNMRDICAVVDLCRLHAADTCSGA